MVLLKQIGTAQNWQTECGRLVWAIPTCQVPHPKQGQPPEVLGLPLPHLSLSATFTAATQEADLGFKKLKTITAHQPRRAWSFQLDQWSDLTHSINTASLNWDTEKLKVNYLDAQVKPSQDHIQMPFWKFDFVFLTVYSLLRKRILKHVRISIIQKIYSIFFPNKSFRKRFIKILIQVLTPKISKASSDGPLLRSSFYLHCIIIKYHMDWSKHSTKMKSKASLASKCSCTFSSFYSITKYS